MNKAHRDRIAFMRICSGKFERNEEYYHVQGGKPIKLAQPQQMMAEERQIIDEAYAGDIIGVFDPGIFSIGDTICVQGQIRSALRASRRSRPSTSLPSSARTR